MTSESVDVLVIGGGPAGLYAARRLAHDGFDVLVCEEHAAVGEPVHCTGVLAAETFDEFDLSRGSVLNSLSTVQFVSPGGLRVSYTTPAIQAVVIDRGLFDRHSETTRSRRGAAAYIQFVSARSKERQPACARASGRAISPRGSSFWRAARSTHCNGAPAWGCRLRTCTRRSANCRRSGSATSSSISGERSHHQVSPGRFPSCARRARTFGSASWPPGPLLSGTRRCSSVSRVRGASRRRSIRRAERILPLGPIERTVGDRLLVVGDAAGIVKPTTGGGIYYSLMSAAMAADVGSHALKRDRLDDPTCGRMSSGGSDV